MVDYFCYITNEVDVNKQAEEIREKSPLEILMQEIFSKNDKMKALHEQLLTSKVEGIFSLKDYKFLGIYESEIQAAVENNKLLIYDESSDKFVNIEGTIIDIKDSTIWPRCSVRNVEYILGKISGQGGKSITTPEQENFVTNWNKHIKTQRPIIETTYKEFVDNAEKYIKLLGKNEKIFMKTLEKGFSSICKIVTIENEPVVVDSTGHTYTTNQIQQHEKVLVSTPIEIAKDKYGKREWRTFVFDDKVLNISRKR